MFDAVACTAPAQPAEQEDITRERYAVRPAIRGAVVNLLPRPPRGREAYQTI